MKYDFEEVLANLVDKYYFLREDFIKSELEYLIEGINDFWQEDEKEKLDNDGLEKAFDERMLDYLKEGFFQDEIAK